MITMNPDTVSVQSDNPTQVDVKPSRGLVIALRTASLAVAYGFWTLSRWLHLAKPVAPPLGIYVLGISALACAFFLFLGTIAPSKTVAKVWKIMGKAVLYILMFT